MDSLQGNPPALELPLLRARGSDQAYRAARADLDVAALANAAPETLLSGWLAMLYRTTRQGDLVTGVAEAGGRVLPLRFELTGELSFTDLTQQCLDVLAAASERGEIALDELLDGLGIDRSALFQVMFSTSEDGVADDRAAGMDLALVARSDDDATHLSLVYNAELFDEDTASRMLGHLETIVTGAVAAPDSPIGTLPFITDAEREQIVREWNDTAIDFPADVCLHEQFEQQVATRPDAVAVTLGDAQLTYAQLNERANKVAHHLRGIGVGPDAMVGISTERSFELVVGLLGIAKAGGAYVPMDPAYPQERIAFMLEDSRVPVLLTQKHLADSIPPSDARVVFLDDAAALDSQPTDNLESGVTAENLCYVIYTSGSTGAPKGVMLEHRGRVNNFLDFNRRFSVTEGDANIALSSLSFDMCAYDVFGTLATGATIVLPQPDHMQNPPYWAQLMNERDVTIWHSAPAMLKMLVDHLESQPELAPQSLRLVLLGGDWIPVSLPDRLRALVSDVQVISMGGATECSMDSTIYEIGAVDPAWNSIPYGEPMKNQLAYVLDPDLQLLPVGVPGELFLGGIGVGRGYYERAELTAERFLDDPFSAAPGARMYRTGDLARWMPDGNLELLGRMDNQVKIRGYRIELGEIESRLNAHAAVLEGVVTTQEDAAGEKRLVAYVVQDPTWQGSETEQDDLGSEQVEQWQAVYDNAYSAQAGDDVEDHTFNIVSWDSSYTNEALPEEEMRAWVDQTVERISRHQPDRVLEIGCGMGLLLFRIAPGCSHYMGTDFSKVALDYVGRHAGRTGLEQVELSRRWADDFSGIEEDSLDCIVLNSIILDFPGMDYLMEVLEGSVRSVKPGGTILVGDVRSNPMIEVYQSSVQLFQADDDLQLEQLEQRAQRLIRQEEELVIDPHFFAWLQTKLPKIGRVQVQLKRGSFTNELNAFRYDVTLHIGDRDEAEVDATWCDWSSDGLDLDALRQKLADEAPSWLGLREVPNARVLRDVRALALLKSDGRPQTAGELRAALDADMTEGAGVNPEDVWQLGDELGYDVDIRWAASTVEGRFDVALHKRGDTPAPSVLFPDDSGLPTDPNATAADFANNPMLGKLSRQLGPELRRHLTKQLPDYMVPAVYVPLDAFPLSPNGKVDRKRLPAPDTSRPDMETQFEAPQTPLQEVVAGIWTDVLGLDRVGVDDAFLDLGGHSLLAVQIQARLTEIFPFEISLPDIFESRTVARLSAFIETQGQKHGVDVADVCETLQMIERMSDTEIQSQIASDS